MLAYALILMVCISTTVGVFQGIFDPKRFHLSVEPSFNWGQHYVKCILVKSVNVAMVVKFVAIRPVV